MWILSKNAKKLALTQADLEALVLRRTAELQLLSQHLLRVQDEERRSVARDLHDSTGQTLAALKMSVALLQEKLAADPVGSAMALEVASLADQALQEIRTTSYLLHPPLLDEAGFESAAMWFVEGFAKRSGIKVKMDMAAERQRLPLGVETALFRVLQESLTNVHRHSGAREVSVRFQRGIDNVRLEIEDFGHGISEEKLNRLRGASSETGVGLAGMRERMNEIKGKLEINSDGRGTTMRATVPLLVDIHPAMLDGFGNGAGLARAVQA